MRRPLEMTLDRFMNLKPDDKIMICPPNNHIWYVVFDKMMFGGIAVVHEEFSTKKHL